LGNTGYRVSEIGFGGWGIGGEMWRGVDDAEGRKALREAVEQGITCFDTALAYGDGHSERVIGETLKDDIRANRVVVTTKIPPMNRQWPGTASYKLGDVWFVQKDFGRALERYRQTAEALPRWPRAREALGAELYYQILRTSLAVTNAPAAGNPTASQQIVMTMLIALRIFRTSALAKGPSGPEITESSPLQHRSNRRGPRPPYRPNGASTM